MRLGRAARKQLAALIADATPLQGDFFRSVAFRYFHPDDVISGEGTRLNGGRFVPVGVKAIYASADEETAMREVTARKRALGGRNQIDVGEYPRMTYVYRFRRSGTLIWLPLSPKNCQRSFGAVFAATDILHPKR